MRLGDLIPNGAADLYLASWRRRTAGRKKFETWRQIGTGSMTVAQVTTELADIVRAMGPGDLIEIQVDAMPSE